MQYIETFYYYSYLKEIYTRQKLFFMNLQKSLEWFGVITAIVYSLLVAFNIGAEFLGFTLLLIFAIAIGVWAYLGKHKGILFLQFFYASAGIIGVIRWF